MDLDLPESRRLRWAVLIGLVAGGLLYLEIEWELSLLAVWDVTVVLMLGWIWLAVSRLDAAQTRAQSTREDPGRNLTRALLLTASIASLVGVIYAFVQAGDADGTRKVLLTGFAAITVVCSWGLVHTLHMLRYAHLYYSDVADEPPGGIDFKNDIAPTYADFAYVAFTIGMTFQVADTDVTSPTIRRAVIRHSALSYVFGTVIVASAINIIAGAFH
jgi:uncharacterized membrane protein